MYLKKKNYYFLGLGDGAARHWAQYCDARYIAVPRADPSKQNLPIGQENVEDNID